MEVESYLEEKFPRLIDGEGIEFLQAVEGGGGQRPVFYVPLGRDGYTLAHLIYKISWGYFCLIFYTSADTETEFVYMFISNMGWHMCLQSGKSTEFSELSFVILKLSFLSRFPTYRKSFKSVFVQYFYFLSLYLSLCIFCRFFSGTKSQQLLHLRARILSILSLLQYKL